MPGIYHIQGKIKHYDWGGNSFIPGLLLTDNTGGFPFAEYWLGTHSEKDSSDMDLPGNHSRSLLEYINETPSLLGKQVQQKFGRLPYLLKLLDVKDMLSIQVHPSKAEAEKSFAAENEMNIPLDSPLRNYKDDNHKPELMVAVSDFWLLYGFKPKDELIERLKTIAELNELLPLLEQSGCKGLYKKVMEMTQEEVTRILRPLIERVVPLYKENKLEKSDENFWAARAALTFNQAKDIDRGIFSIYFFNLVHLKRGEATFQDAGVPHAYLEGENVEIMANSDNVLRGGLTNKHIDVNELLKHISCEPGPVKILQPQKLNDYEKTYQTPAPDFELHRIDLEPGQSAFFSPVTAEILLLTEGMVKLKYSGEELDLKRGALSAIAFPGGTVTVNALKKATIFRATVPIHKGE